MAEHIPRQQGTRSATVLADRRREVAARYLHGISQREIGTALGISQTLVSRTLHELRADWVEAARMDFGTRQAEELAKIDRVEAEAWAAWSCSQQSKETTLTEMIDEAQPSKKASVRRQQQYGDPRFLACIQGCIEQRCKILGLFAPTRVRVNWDELTDTQLQRLADGADPAQVMAEA